jgi:hypothetical protein
MKVLDILSSEETCSKLLKETQWRNSIHSPDVAQKN